MDKAKIAEGLSLLVGTKSFAQRVRQINEIVDGWEDTPLVFAGVLEPLNSLVDVGLANREAMDKLIDLAKAKRAQVPTSKRVDYQRALMKEKRDRLFRAIELEELVRGATIRGEARRKYMLDIQSMWMKERNAFIAAKGELNWKQRNESAGEFWQQVDAKLASDLAEAKSLLDRPPMKHKRVAEVSPPKPKVVTVKSKAFEASSVKRKK